MKLSNFEKAKKSVGLRCPESVVEMIADCFDDIDNCNSRLDKEGLVVRDLKGNILPHPALAIKNNQTKIASDMIKKFS